MLFLFSPFGRVSLGQFWLKFLLPMLAAQIVAALADVMFFGAPSLLSMAVGFFYLWPSFAVTIKRFHDHGMTGFWILGHSLLGGVAIVSGVMALGPVVADMQGDGAALLIFVPSLLGVLWLSSLVYLLPGSRSANAYGDEPTGRGYHPHADNFKAHDTWAQLQAARDREEDEANASGRRHANPAPASLLAAGARPTFGRRGL